MLLESLNIPCTFAERVCRALARILKFPIFFWKECPLKNDGLKWYKMVKNLLKLYKMVQSSPFLPVKNGSYQSKWTKYFFIRILGINLHLKGIVSDSNNIFLWHDESDDINKKKIISKISVDFNFTFTIYAWLPYMHWHCSKDYWAVLTCWQDFIWKLLLFHTEMTSA